MPKLVAILAAGIASFVAAAILLTILDLSLSGHGVAPLAHRPLLDSDALGVHLSVADAVAFGVAGLAAAAVGLAYASRHRG